MDVDDLDREGCHLVDVDAPRREVYVLVPTWLRPRPSGLQLVDLAA